MKLQEIKELLSLRGQEAEQLRQKAGDVKKMTVGNKVYFRGLVEYSNICAKNCYYCGIRASNDCAVRYQLSDEEVFECVDFAWKKNFASAVLQSGELSGLAFTQKIEFLLQEIHKRTRGEIAMTLSCGEQSEETYRRWRDAGGARRYLLRIETTNTELYKKIHPDNSLHSFEERMRCLETLRKLDYQVGSGIMMGLPFQTLEDIARDLLFLKEFDVDMVGMGPYIEHEYTPLYAYKEELPSKEERFATAVNAVAILRLLMPDINIAATTALQTLNPTGREQAIAAGANVIMPNLTPTKYRENYLLYENKPGVKQNKEETSEYLEKALSTVGHEIAYGVWGDALHYGKRKQS